MIVRVMRRTLTSLLNLSRTALVCVALLCAHSLDAQDHPQDHDQGPAPSGHQHHMSAGDDEKWTWMTDANVFTGFNYQQRKFADFSAWESQNWFMLMGSRRVGPGDITITGMTSLEPLTVGWVREVAARTGGSPQLYQTGESYQQEPIVNYQHPHDLVMAAGVGYRIKGARATYTLEADLVGSPALGPTAFMHRESARDNPQVPLGHHAMDSTHITPGVVTGGIRIGEITFETSAFRGEEPDENRYNIEQPKLDSYSGRISWARGPWQAQFSGGHLHEPEWFEPYDETRLTASIGFGGEVASRPLHALIAWGRNIEYNGFDDRADSYLLEWDFRASDKNTTYGRIEHLRKQVFGLGLHPKGFNHRHMYSRIDALTLGYVRDFLSAPWGRFGAGADATLYATSDDLIPFYGGSHSYHFFVRWRPHGGASMMSH